MSNLLPGDLFQFPINCLQGLGYLVTNRKITKTAVFFMAVAVILSGFTLNFCMFQLIFIPNDIFGLVDNVECLGAHLQVFGKIIFVIHKKKQVMKLITLSKKLWNPNVCSGKTQHEINQLSQGLYKLQKVFVYSYAICLAFMGVPVIFFGKSLPIGVWQIKNQPELHLVFKILMQVFILYYGFIVANLDNLFLAFCVELGIQFKILCDVIRKLSVKEISNESGLQVHCDKLQYCIKYHKFLISYLSELKSIFSYILMVQYLSIVPLICIQLFASMESSNFVFTLRFLSIAFCLSMQLIMYCEAAEFVSNEASKVPIAVYSSDWYSQHFKILKIPLNLFIQVSQQDVEFIACGLVRINANTIVNVFKLAMSTNTLLRNLKHLS